MVDLDRSISVARKSGKTLLGINYAIKAVKNGEAKVVVVAANAPVEKREDLEYYAEMSNIPLVEYPKTSFDLGITCGRAHLTSAVAILDEGDSDILEAI